MLKVLVLGSAAGGGSPQWNCNSHVSKLVRQGLDGTTPRTQSSIAVTSNNKECQGLARASVFLLVILGIPRN